MCHAIGKILQTKKITNAFALKNVASKDKIQKIVSIVTLRVLSKGKMFELF